MRTTIGGRQFFLDRPAVERAVDGIPPGGEWRV
jgi:hypothetical protein